METGKSSSGGFHYILRDIDMDYFEFCQMPHQYIPRNLHQYRFFDFHTKEKPV